VWGRLPGQCVPGALAGAAGDLVANLVLSVPTGHFAAFSAARHVPGRWAHRWPDRGCPGVRRCRDLTQVKVLVGGEAAVIGTTAHHLLNSTAGWVPAGRL
jgi:hypothetical protein